MLSSSEHKPANHFEGTPASNCYFQVDSETFMVGEGKYTPLGLSKSLTQFYPKQEVPAF
jgi:hypothetical protein